MKSTIFSGLNKIRKRIVAILAIIALTGISTPIILSYINPHTNPYFQKIDDFPLYFMNYTEFKGENNYDIYNYSLGSSSILQESSVDAWGCTCFAALNSEGDCIFGRNFDWYDAPKLLLYTDSTGGYASYTMVDLGMLGFQSENQFNSASDDELQKLMQSPYWCLDGMNEHGLTIGCMAVPHAIDGLNPNKITIGSLGIMRVILDYAKNVNEAIIIFNEFNIIFNGGPPLHYMIADAEGNSVIVEFINGEKKFILNENPWQVSTNFNIYGSSTEEINDCWRYKNVEINLSSSLGLITSSDAMILLEDVSQEITQWSNVYNMNNGDISIVMGRKFEEILIYNFFSSHSYFLK